MQIMANVLNRPIKIARSEQTCALGAAMFAATAAGIYKDIPSAMNKMGAGFDQEFQPDPKQAAIYDKIYADYCKYGEIIEQSFE